LIGKIDLPLVQCRAHHGVDGYPAS
jgi:hypothetical protein